MLNSFDFKLKYFVEATENFQRMDSSDFVYVYSGAPSQTKHPRKYATLTSIIELKDRV